MPQLGNNHYRFEDSQKSSEKQKSSKKIIAVGYELDLSGIRDVLISRLHSKTGYALKKFIIPDTIKAGVLYDKSCPGNLHDAYSNQDEMKAWYEHKEDVDKTVFCSTFYIHPKLIIGEVYIASERFFAVFSNMTAGNQTTMHKKAILAGDRAYGPPITIERIDIPAKAYQYV
jgi:hypothetical protein